MSRGVKRMVWEAATRTASICMALRMGRWECVREAVVRSINEVVKCLMSQRAIKSVYVYAYVYVYVCRDIRTSTRRLKHLLFIATLSVRWEYLLNPGHFQVSR